VRLPLDGWISKTKIHLEISKEVDCDIYLTERRGNGSQKKE